jgi:ribonuclease III
MARSKSTPLKKLEKILGYSFKNKKRLSLALTHSSYKNGPEYVSQKECATEDNERLEFLGDTILSFVISKKLFNDFSDFSEGRLSKYRSILVSKGHLFKVAKELKLIQFLNLGKSEKQGRIADKANILADALEAIIAAVYLDGGMKNAENLILAHFGKYITLRRLTLLDRNYKSMLQEFAQKNHKILPEYCTMLKKDVFHATVQLAHYKKALGTGKSKRDAEQNAAQKLYRTLRSKAHKK